MRQGAQQQRAAGKPVNESLLEILETGIHQ
jgi:hypothetical protein